MQHEMWPNNSWLQQPLACKYTVALEPTDYVTARLQTKTCMILSLPYRLGNILKSSQTRFFPIGKQIKILKIGFSYFFLTSQENHICFLWLGFLWL